MGKKKAGGPAAVVDKGDRQFCYWCNKDFEDERVLIQHQLTKHFRCPVCPPRQSAGKCNTLHGLIIHYRKAHTADLALVPNAVVGRDDIASSINIIGMRFVPEEIVAEWRNGAAPALVFESVPEPVTVAASGFLGDLGNMAVAGSVGMEIMMNSLPQFQEAIVVPAASQPSGSDMAAQVAAWMAAKALEPEEPEPPPPTPIPERLPSPVRMPAELPPPEEPRQPQRVEPVPEISLPVPQQPVFQIPRAAPAAPSYSKAQVQDAAANFLAGALGNLESSRRASSAASTMSSLPPHLQAMANAHSPAHATRIIPASATAAAVPASASTPAAATGTADMQASSRGGRSRSPKKRSRSRDNRAQPPVASAPKPGTYESRTIEIFFTAAVGTRLWLKSEMERFGRVEVCHTGNRNNQVAEPTWVRFEKLSSVERALSAINAGQVLLEGTPIKAEMRSDNRRPQQAQPKRRSPPRSDPGNFSSRDAARGDIRSRDGPGNYSSRDLAKEDRSRGSDRGNEGPGNYSSRDLARDDQRGRMGPGNYSSRDLARQDALRRAQKQSRSRSRRRR